jgi:hypothetical protein
MDLICLLSCLQSYATLICKVDFVVHLQMYLKMPGSIPGSFGANLKLL